jgi:uncharacterized protein
MRRSLIWQRLDEPGLEHFVLEETPDGFVGDGALVASVEGQQYRLGYVVRCDRSFLLRSAELTCRSDENRRVVLARDAAGVWRDEAGSERPTLAGCNDIDITASPFTNTLPIRRLRLRQAQPVEVRVAYIWVPSLTVTFDRQRYTLLQTEAAESLYRFESLVAVEGFVAEVRVDRDGLVVEYEGLFRRL